MQKQEPSISKEQVQQMASSLFKVYSFVVQETLKGMDSKNSEERLKEHWKLNDLWTVVTFLIETGWRMDSSEPFPWDLENRNQEARA